MNGVVLNSNDPPYTNEHETQKQFDESWQNFLNLCGTQNPAPAQVDGYVQELLLKQMFAMSRRGFVSFRALINERIPLENERLRPTIRRNRHGGTYVSQFLSKAFRQFYESAPEFLQREGVPEVLQPVQWPDFIALDAMVWCHPLTDEDSPWKSLRDLLGDHHFITPDGRELGDHHIVRGAYHRFGTNRRENMCARIQVHIPQKYIVTDSEVVVKALLRYQQRQQERPVRR